MSVGVTASNVVLRTTGTNSSLALKAPVRCATTGPITLSGLQTIDGITFQLSDVAFPNTGTNRRVLVKNQIDLTQNGIYDVNTAAWTRSADFDSNDDAAQGTRVQVVQGNVNQGTWLLLTADPVYLTNSGSGVSNITWAPQNLVITAIGTISSVAGVTQIIGTPGNLNQVVTSRAYAVEGDGGGGTFVWSANNHATDVTNDPQHAFFVPPSSDLTGASGAWVRQYSGPVSITWFGAHGDGVTDNSQAFIGFNIWARTQTTAVYLLIPPGNYFLNLSDNPQSLGGNADLLGCDQWMKGIKSLIISGYGATVQGVWLGGQGTHPTTDVRRSARFQTAQSQAASVTLVTPSDNTIFSVGMWVVLSQIDMQGSGFPHNPFVFEYAKISSINAGTGVITFVDPIRHAYRSTYPNYTPFVANSTFDNGGPATIWALEPSWDTDVAIYGLTFNNLSGNLFSSGRNIKLADCDLTPLSLTAPSQAMKFALHNCKFSSMEVDKLVETLIYESCTGEQLQFQSASMERTKISNSRINIVLGTGKNCRIVESEIGNLTPGCIGYGFSESLVIENSKINVVHVATISVATSSLTFSNGSLTANLSLPIGFMVPGALCFFGANFINYGTPFRILDLSKSGATTTINTTLSAIPASNSSTILVHPCPRMSVKNCTGCPDIVNLSQAGREKPLFSYAKTLIVGDPNAQAMSLWGQLVSVTCNVIRAYTGAQGTLNLHLNGQFGTEVVQSDSTTTFWDPTVNLKIAGTRIILPGSESGAQSGDSITHRGSGNTWFDQVVNPTLSASVAGDTIAQLAIVELEFVTDQGSFSTDRLMFFNANALPI